MNYCIYLCLIVLFYDYEVHSSAPLRPGQNPWQRVGG